MLRKSLVSILVSISMIAAICGGIVRSASADDRNSQVEQAIKAAEAWLKLVDDGKYRESWEQSASLFRDKITPEGWEKLAKSTRAHTGALVSRKFKLAAYATSLPGAPPGQYVVIEYDASYANIQSAIDKVTPMLDTDGQWHVSGYWIQ